MKYLIQGLFSLVLLAFVYAESGSTGKPMTTYDKDSNSTANSTSKDPHTSGSPTSTDPNMVTGGPGAGGLTGKTTVTTKNGESHIVTSVGLLLASAILHTLWQ